MTYRRDIDGFRAIAVLAVVLFHCDFATVPGGFVGVDVFFVISGYLITKIILADLEGEGFSFRTFFLRRVRRLLPAVIATVIVVNLVALALFTPKHLAETGETSLWVLASLANFHFAMTVDYFETAAKLKPLLHTWSLGVEEQFYLVWPAMLAVVFALGRRRAALAVILLGFLASLALSEYWIGRNPVHAYYLPPFRAYQFLLGAAIIWAERWRAPPVLEGAALVGGIGIVVATSLLYTEATPFPGVWGLIPSLGAALVLWAGRAPGASALLTNRPMVWVGRISYSVYLVHWPIAVFWRYLSPAPFELWEKWTLFGLSLAFGQLLYDQVERRFRLGRSDPRVRSWRLLRPVGATIALVGAPVWGLHAAAGLPQRLALAPESASLYQDSLFQFLRDYRDGELALGDPDGAERVLIFGDSMMQNYIPALLEIPRLAKARVEVVSRGGCVLAKGMTTINFGSRDRVCDRLRERLLARTGPYDLVIWSQNWSDYTGNLYEDRPDGPARTPRDAASLDRWRAGLDTTLAHFEGRAERMVVIGPQVVAEGVNPMLRRIGPMTDPETVTGTFAALRPGPSETRDQLAAEMADYFAARSREESTPTTYIDPRDLVCPDGACAFRQDGRSLYMDEIHHSAAATPMLRDRLAARLR